MILADFNYYQLEFRGVQITDPDAYDRLATRATTELDYYTFGRASHNADLDAVKMCACALAEQSQRVEVSLQSASGGPELQSESVGSYSRSYRSVAEVSKAAKQETGEIIERYLAHTGLMYRGVNGCSLHIQ